MVKNMKKGRSVVMIDFDGREINKLNGYMSLDLVAPGKIYSFEYLPMHFEIPPRTGEYITIGDVEFEITKVNYELDIGKNEYNLRGYCYNKDVEEKFIERFKGWEIKE